MIKKLNPNHLKRLLNNSCDVELYQEGLSEEGEPLSFIKLENQKCRFVEKTKIIIDAEGKKIMLVGKVILLSDVAPDLKKISGGIVKVNSVIYEIYQANRPRNPDGSVYMSVLELM